MTNQLDLDHLRTLCRDDYAGELGVPADQVLALLDEVERLREEGARIRGLLAKRDEEVARLTDSLAAAEAENARLRDAIDRHCTCSLAAALGRGAAPMAVEAEPDEDARVGAAVARLIAAFPITDEEFPSVTFMLHPDGDVRAALDRRNGCAAVRPSLVEAVERLAEMAGLAARVAEAKDERLGAAVFAVLARFKRVALERDGAGYHVIPDDDETWPGSGDTLAEALEGLAARVADGAGEGPSERQDDRGCAGEPTGAVSFDAPSGSQDAATGRGEPKT